MISSPAEKAARDLIEALGPLNLREGANRAIFDIPYTLDAEYGGIRIVEDFGLRIAIPDGYPLELPQVSETTDVIPRNYKHLYSNGSFCLGVNGELGAALSNDPSLPAFFDEFVVSYLYTAVFYLRYGRYPYGDRSHGAAGVLEYYSELFGTNSPQAYTIMRSIASGNYRGHLPCPCGSGIRGRNCHGKQILGILDSQMKKHVMADFRLIEAESETWISPWTFRPSDHGPSCTPRIFSSPVCSSLLARILTSSSSTSSPSPTPFQFR